MSDFKHKDMQGSLFRNEKKANDKAPSHTGTCMINGQELRIAAWVNTATSSRTRYFSLKFSEPQQQATEPASQDELDDQIPF